MYRSKLTLIWKRLVRISSRPTAGLLFGLLLAVLTISIMAIFVYSSREAILEYDWRFRWQPLAISFALYSLALFLTMLVWGHIVNVLVGRRSWWDHARIFYLSNLGRRLPGILWHAAGRVILYSRIGVGKKIISVGSGLELALILVAGSAVGLIAWPIFTSVRVGRPCWLALAIVAGLALIHPRTVNWVIRKLGANRALDMQLSYRRVIWWLISYMGIWTLGGIVLFFIINIVYPIDGHAPPGIIGAWSISGVIATMATFSPSGFGLREVSLTLLLSAYMPAGIAAAIAILLRIIGTLFEVIWAIAISLIASRFREAAIR